MPTPFLLLSKPQYHSLYPELPISFALFPFHLVSCKQAILTFFLFKVSTSSIDFFLLAEQIPGNQNIATSIRSSENGNPRFDNLPKWCFSKHEIDDCSPSRKDVIDFAKESKLRELYCFFIKDLGQKLKVPQVTIVCALMLCHRFYLRQSHMKNVWQTIATASMFLACKIEETPRPLRDVVVAYEMIYQQDPAARQRIRRIEFCDKQKELIISGERLLLTTIAFDLDIKLPYRPLVDASKKLDLSRDFANVAWKFVNDWLCTTLCLQYKPHYIAAGSLFLASKLLKVKLPKKKGKLWWLEFDISPKQLVGHRRDGPGVGRKGTSSASNTWEGHSPRTAVGKMITNSAQSTITSVSIASSHSTSGAVIESEFMAKRNFSVQAALPSQTSNSEGTSSHIDDGDSQSQPRGVSFHLNPNSKIVSIHNSSSKIDANRIRKALKRKQSEVAAKKTETIDAEVGSEAWIERELENGIEMEAASLEKK